MHIREENKDDFYIKLTPGKDGEDCLGNGSHYDDNGNLIECCCDECDYLMICCNYKNKTLD